MSDVLHTFSLNSQFCLAQNTSPYEALHSLHGPMAKNVLDVALLLDATVGNTVGNSEKPVEWTSLLCPGPVQLTFEIFSRKGLEFSTA